ncbi:MAG TPA: dTMP kinase [Phycisphaerae bacterium]|nr:dTMP kinase [Phycisphaerae bacterium]
MAKQENHEKLEALAGKFIVFDGLDGCGKTTQLDILEGKLTKQGIAVRRVRDPGGTAIGEQIREILLTSKGDGMSIRTEMLLYMASRAQLVFEEIKPSLSMGKTVLSDRFTSSTLAYQGAAGGLKLEQIIEVTQTATEGLWPDLTIILDISVETAMARMQSTVKRGGAALQPGLFHDRIENRVADFHHQVREGFLEQIKRFPEKYRFVSAAGTREQTEAAVDQTLGEFFNFQR